MPSLYFTYPVCGKALLAHFEAQAAEDDPSVTITVECPQKYGAGYGWKGFFPISQGRPLR
jgi:hypothetical protein